MVHDLNISDSDEGEIHSDLDENIEEELSNFPHAVAYIKRLKQRVKWQKKKLQKLRNKLLEQKRKNILVEEKGSIDCGTQTNPLDQELSAEVDKDWVTKDSKFPDNIVELVTEAAESAAKQTGFVYEETSGLYYDYKSGYYYDASRGLYYDGNSGIYYFYDEETKSHKFHSQVQQNQSEEIPTQSQAETKEKRKANKAVKEVKKRKTKHNEGVPDKNEEPEEGECSDSQTSCDITPELSSTSSESETEDGQDIIKDYPPCMRITVKETELKKLKVGSLFLVTCTGGSMGREGDHSVLIPDINISKFHARFQYNEEKKQYEIIDSGSRNGTFLNGKRLSVAKQESEPHQIVHGSIIQIGSTKLLCHIHNGHETCGHCEPGLILTSSVANEIRSNVKIEHKVELRRLKYKFGVEKDNVQVASQVAAGYQDRALARRVCVGSSDDHAKTHQTSVDTSIAKDNKGFKLLSKMGWSEGQALGKDGAGRMEPVPLVQNHNKAGLGANTTDLSSLQVDSSTEKKQALWRKTQQRYSELSE